mmetsp:Transcript_12904/g.15310  ORF Transcript_12904/g.15310 Transcript_12904/m.15310 type:complete len:230 (+) Transcript_12904:28-717(+)
MLLLSSLKAFSVNNRWSRLIVFLLANPHLLEGRKRCQNGSSNPHRVLALRWSHDLDLHRLRSKPFQLLLHAFSNSGEHRSATRKHGVSVEVLADVHIALHDAVVCGLSDAVLLEADEGWLEEHLWAAESFVADGDYLTVGKLVRLLKSGGGFSLLHLLVKIESNVGELLLDVTNDLTLSRGGERVATFSEYLHHEISQIAASKVQPFDSVRKSVSFVDGNGVRHTIARV